ncbi:hypothetical protein M1O50_04970 [Dehalococcoidia bacterium]|nr:hypothetical protein [Dehalococcoidia bacterium]
MKTKHRILSVLTTLALVASLTAVMVAPAGAQAVTVSPPEGAVGTVVTVTGTWPVAGYITSVTFAGAAVTTSPALPLEIKEAGDPYTITFRVPAGPIRDKTIAVSDGVRTATGTFTIEPKVTISPRRGPEGSPATATVTGFAAGVSVDVFAGGKRVGGGVTTDATGSATVPLTMEHAGKITARDGAGNPSEHHPHTFEFTPGITLDPTTGLGGVEVTIEGRDFTRDGNIPAGRIEFAGETLKTPEIPLTDLDDDGIKDDFEETITVPPGETPGPKVVRVTDSDGKVATAIFDVIGPALDAITLDPEEGVPGQSVLVTGVHFPELTWVSLRFADGGTKLDELKEAGKSIVLASAVPTDSLGNLHPTTVTIPLVTPGKYRIWAIQEDDPEKASDDALFEVKAPEVVIGVRDGLHAVWDQLGESVWQFKDGVWYQYLIAAPEMVPEAVRLTELRSGMAYWIYLTEDITDIHFGGMTRTLEAGWHNIAWQ